MARKKVQIEKAMRRGWQQILDLLPEHRWQIAPAAIQVGYSPKYAFTTLPGILERDARFCKALEAKKAALAKKHELNADRIIHELKCIAFSDIGDFITTNKDGELRLVDLTEIDRDKLAALEVVRVHKTKRSDGDDEDMTTRQIYLKLHSKLRALEQLGKICGLSQRGNNQQKDQIQLQVMKYVLNRDGKQATPDRAC